MERLTLQELNAAIAGRPLAAGDRRITFQGVAIDSRQIEPGQLFWAIRGPHQDGHAFLDDARRRGAVAAVVDQQHVQSQQSNVSKTPFTEMRIARESLTVDETHRAVLPLLCVADSTAALKQFAAWYRRLQDAFLIAITGSVGKTSTREMLFCALGNETAGMRSPRNYNNQFGVPLTLSQLERRHRFGVIEIGASQTGEVAELSRMVRPEAGIITRLGVAHIETFGGVEQIAAGKGELLDALPRSGFALLPGDQPRARQLALRSAAPVRFVGLGNDCDVRPQSIETRPELLRFRLNNTRFEVRANGAHFAVGASMAITAARQLGRSDQQIANALQAFEPVNGRCRVVQRQPFTVIDDTYNANPDSMAAALTTLASWPAAGRRIFVCGDMWGLGHWTADAHFELGQQVAMQGIHQLVAIGANARQVTQGSRSQGMEARCLASFSHRGEATAWLSTFCQPGDVILVKASRPLELERLVAELCASAHQGRAVA